MHICICIACIYCLGRLWMSPPLKCTRPGWMGLCATWSTGGIPANSKGFGTRQYQWSFTVQKPFYNSMILSDTYVTRSNWANSEDQPEMDNKLKSTWLRLREGLNKQHLQQSWLEADKKLGLHWWWVEPFFFSPYQSGTVYFLSILSWEKEKRVKNEYLLNY